MDLSESLRKAVLSGRDYRLKMKDGSAMTGLIIQNSDRVFRIFHSRLPPTAPRGWQEGEALDVEAIESIEPA